LLIILIFNTQFVIQYADIFLYYFISYQCVYGLTISIYFLYLDFLHVKLKAGFKLKVTKRFLGLKPIFSLKPRKRSWS